MIYEIRVATDDDRTEFHGTPYGSWDSESYLIAEDNKYGSVDEALEAIDHVRGLSDGPEKCTYAVAEVGNWSSLCAVVRPED